MICLYDEWNVARTPHREEGAPAPEAWHVATRHNRARNRRSYPSVSGAFAHIPPWEHIASLMRKHAKCLLINSDGLSAGRQHVSVNRHQSDREPLEDGKCRRTRRTAPTTDGKPPTSPYNHRPRFVFQHQLYARAPSAPGRSRWPPVCAPAACTPRLSCCRRHKNGASASRPSEHKIIETKNTKKGGEKKTH